MYRFTMALLLPLAGACVDLPTEPPAKMTEEAVAESEGTMAHSTEEIRVYWDILSLQTNGTVTQCAGTTQGNANLDNSAHRNRNLRSTLANCNLPGSRQVAIGLHITGIRTSLMRARYHEGGTRKKAHKGWEPPNPDGGNDWEHDDRHSYYAFFCGVRGNGTTWDRATGTRETWIEGLDYGRRRNVTNITDQDSCEGIFETDVTRTRQELTDDQGEIRARVLYLNASGAWKARTFKATF